MMAIVLRSSHTDEQFNVHASAPVVMLLFCDISKHIVSKAGCVGAAEAVQNLSQISERKHRLAIHAATLVKHAIIETHFSRILQMLCLSGHTECRFQEPEFISDNISIST